MIFYGKYNKKKTENGTLVNHADQIFTKNRCCLPILSSNQILNKQLANQPSKIDLTLFHQNISGLTINKIDEISIYLSNKPNQIISLVLIFVEIYLKRVVYASLLIKQYTI